MYILPLISVNYNDLTGTSLEWWSRVLKILARDHAGFWKQKLSLTRRGGAGTLSETPLKCQGVWGVYWIFSMINLSIYIQYIYKYIYMYIYIYVYTCSLLHRGVMHDCSHRSLTLAWIKLIRCRQAGGAEELVHVPYNFIYCIYIYSFIWFFLLYMIYYLYNINNYINIYIYSYR
jgi:hypothetical protein